MQVLVVALIDSLEPVLVRILCVFQPVLILHRVFCLFRVQSCIQFPKSYFTLTVASYLSVYISEYTFFALPVPSVNTIIPKGLMMHCSWWQCVYRALFPPPANIFRVTFVVCEYVKHQKAPTISRSTSEWIEAPQCSRQERAREDCLGVFACAPLLSEGGRKARKET